MQPQTRKKILSLNSISELYDIPKNTLYKISSRRELEVIKLGRKVYFDVSDWEQYLEKHKTGGKPRVGI